MVVALGAGVRDRIAADVALDAPVEVSVVQLAQTDGCDVEVEFGRVDIVADGHVDLQRLEVGRLGHRPPEVHHVPRQLGLLAGKWAFYGRGGDDLGLGFFGAEKGGRGKQEAEGEGSHGDGWKLDRS